MAATPELVAPGVYRVDAIRLSSAINVLLLEDDDGWTLVDTGTANSAGRIQEAVTALGSGPGLKRIFVTHHHPDHAGGVKGLIEWAPQAESRLPSRRRSSPADAPDEPASAFFRPIASRQNVPPAPVAKVLSEGDLVSGFRIISTPGHSLGHVSLLRDADGVLFTADAFGCLPRKIRVGVRKYLCADPPLARRSAGSCSEKTFRP